MSTNDSKLFSSIKYFTTGFHDPALEKIFKENGATLSFYLTETTTHVICDDFDSNKSELEQAIEIYQTPIVKSDWITACLKCNVLLPIEPFRSFDSNPTDHLFRSYTFTNANLSIDDHQKIYALVTYYGGQWSSNIENEQCTHIVCASARPVLDSETETNQEQQRLHHAYEIQSEKIHLITPDWIIDCLNANQVLDVADYHPDLLRDPNEPMDLEEDELDDEIQNDSTNNQSTEEHSPIKTSVTTHRSQLITKNFFNQADQTTPPPSADPVQDNQDHNNVSDFPDTSQTKVIPPKRSRAKASNTTPRQRNTKMNAAAQNNLHATQNGHLSTAKDGNLTALPIEEKLIRPSLTMNVLNNKTNIPVGRHPATEALSYELGFCIQDKHELVPSSQCLLGCIIYIDEQEYISTVSKDDLVLWSKTLSDHGAIVTDDVNHPHLTHFVCAYRISELFRLVCKRNHVRLVTAHWLNDVLQRKKLFVPNLAIHYPSPYVPNEPDKLPLTKYFFAMTGFEGIERARLRYMIRALGGKYSGQLTRWHTHLLARENTKNEKLKKALEWSITIVNGLWLSELYLGNTFALKQPLEDRYRRLGVPPTIDHFSFDQIFVHDLLVPWSQPIHISDDMLNSAIRRHHEQLTHPSTQTHDIDQNNIYSKSSYHYHHPHDDFSVRLSTSTEQNFSIMLSGFDTQKSHHYETIIQSLGGQISNLPHSTTHLIMSQCLRTEKFYQCLNYVNYILKTTWLDRSSEAKCFVPIEESDWLIIDESNGATQNLLKQSIDKRNQREHRPIFRDWTFFLTPSIRPSPIVLQSIIYSAGGNLYRQFPSIKQLTTLNEQSKRPHCLIISCDKDKVLLQDLSKYNNTDIQIKILSIDFILESLVQQEIPNIDSFLLKI